MEKKYLSWSLGVNVLFWMVLSLYIYFISRQYQNISLLLLIVLGGAVVVVAALEVYGLLRWRVSEHKRMLLGGILLNLLPLGIILASLFLVPLTP